MEVRPRGRPRQQPHTGSAPSTKIRKSKVGNSTTLTAMNQDESAAERRRAQVRIAQRAYRQKQESTLLRLRQRAAELTDTMNLMNKFFIDHRDGLMRSKLADDQLQEVQQTASAMESLMDVLHGSSQGNAEKAVARKGQRKHAKFDVGESILEPKHVSDWIDPTVLVQHKQSQQRDVRPFSWGYALPIQSLSPTLGYVPGLAPSPTPIPTASRIHSQDDQQNARAHPMALHLGSIPQQPRPPRTYSFAETTFARRLHRATVEQAYKLLHEFDSRPLTYKKAFRLSLMSRDRQTLIEMTKQMLARGPREPLDQETALIHVGGAGTHYPKLDAFGRPQPKPQTWYAGIVGPQALALVEDAAKKNITVDMTVDIAGLEGEWFDPYDVEGYLAEKGIHIDPFASFAVAEVVASSVHLRTTSVQESAFPGIDASSLESSVALPFMHQLSIPQLSGEEEQAQSPSGAGIDVISDETLAFPTVGFSDAATGSWMNFMPTAAQEPTTHALTETQTRAPDEATTSDKTSALPTVGFSDAATGSWMNVMPSAQAAPTYTSMTAHARAPSEMIDWETLPSLKEVLQATVEASATNASETMHGAPQPKKTIIIDVPKLIHFLMVFSVCLCRTPGFNRVDVDRALELSSVDAY